MVEQWAEVIASIAGWYLSSFATLLLNKYLLGSMHIQPNTLAIVQMISTAIYGGLKTIKFRTLRRDLTEIYRSISHNSGGAREKVDLDLEDLTQVNGSGDKWRKALMQMSLVGVMRFATVVLGLVSLKYVAASFTETVKASAPFFTVIFAFFMLGERTTPKVVVSLVPVAGGLLVASAAELSFNLIGFLSAVSTNGIECVQNVFSKRLLARDYTAQQLQFYTSLTALALQVPLLVCQQVLGAEEPPHEVPVALAARANVTLGIGLLHDGSGAAAAPLAATVVPVWDSSTLALLWLAGLLYHLQSVVAYVVMSYLSPVTVSVVNTVKRAMAIWISVIVFGNEVTCMTMVGTAFCLLGALWYNVARQQTSTKAAK